MTLTMAVLVPSSPAKSGENAHFARDPKPASEDGGEQTFAPFDSRACPESRELTGSGWRGFLRAAATAKVQQQCGHRGRWSYFRAHPPAGDVEVSWESATPVALAIGWGACDAPPRFCGEAGAQRISNWPQGAALWIAVLDPSAPQDSPEDEDKAESSDGTQSGEGSGDSGETQADPGLALSLRWRLR